jgi:hypothetical protein
MSFPRSALAGAAAAGCWAALEPFDQRLVGHSYSDVAVLGKFITRSRLWPLAGVAIHVANGAAFGLVFEETRRQLRVPPRRLALRLALAEHLALFPLGYVVDRRHPARGEPGLAPLFSTRAFAQATLRHAVFGVLLGAFADA